MFRKRGQAAAGAAVLLAIIAGLIIMFVILIPPQERADLLGEEVGDSDDRSSSSSSSSDELEDERSKKNLLQENPGRVDYLAQSEIEHPLPVVNVYTATESKILAERNLVQVKKGVFSEDVGTFPFSISDVQNTDEVLLSFSIGQSQGDLIIELNGQEIVHAAVAQGNIQPVKLPKNMLQRDNTLTFKVSSPGLAFWATNKITVNSIKVVGDVTSLDAQSSKNVFLMSDVEKSNLEKVVLKFQPSCQYGDVGPLRVVINGNEIYNAVPDCDVALIPIDISADFVRSGENTIIFSTEQGRYILSHVMLESRLKEVDFPTFYFDLELEDYDEVKADDLRLRLHIDFVDVRSAKRGELIVNGKTRHFDTRESTFTLDISEDAEEGTNSIKVKPRKTIEIRKMEVDLVNS